MNGRRARQVTTDELALWRHVMRDASPLREEAAAAVPAAAAPASAAAALAAPPPAAAPAEANSGLAPPFQPARVVAHATRRLDPAGPVDLDRRTWLKLRRGNYPIDARIDLHGLTQADAFARLAGFLAMAQARGNRCVLVITGRGVRHGGTLRGMTPRWLDEQPNRTRVLAYALANRQHGGEGALYVLLRRPGPAQGSGGRA